MIIDETDTKRLAFLIILMVVLPTLGLFMLVSPIFAFISILMGSAFLLSKRKSPPKGSPTTEPIIEPTAEIAYGRVLASEVTCALCRHKNPSDARFCIKCGDHMHQGPRVSSDY